MSLKGFKLMPYNPSLSQQNAYHIHTCLIYPNMHNYFVFIVCFTSSALKENNKKIILFEMRTRSSEKGVYYFQWRFYM